MVEAAAGGQAYRARPRLMLRPDESKQLLVDLHLCAPSKDCVVEPPDDERVAKLLGCHFRVAFHDGAGDRAVMLLFRKLKLVDAIPGLIEKAHDLRGVILVSRHGGVLLFQLRCLLVRRAGFASQAATRGASFAFASLSSASQCGECSSSSSTYSNSQSRICRGTLLATFL